jgi:hypothetical protein
MLAETTYYITNSNPNERGDRQYVRDFFNCHFFMEGSTLSDRFWPKAEVQESSVPRQDREPKPSLIGVLIV